MFRNLINFTYSIYYTFITQLFELKFLYYKKKYQLSSDIIMYKNKKFQYFDTRLKVKNSKFIQLYSIYLYLRKKKINDYTFFDLGCGWGNVIFFLNLKKIFHKYVGYDTNNNTIGFCKKKFKSNNISFKKKNILTVKFKRKSVYYLNTPSKDLINKIFKNNKKNLNKNIIFIILNIDIFKDLKINYFKNYKSYENKGLRYFIFDNCF